MLTLLGYPGAQGHNGGQGMVWPRQPGSLCLLHDEEDEAVPALAETKDAVQMDPGIEQHISRFQKSNNFRNEGRGAFFPGITTELSHN